MNIDFKYINVVNHVGFVRGQWACCVPIEFKGHETGLGGDYDRFTGRPFQYYPYIVEKLERGRVYGKTREGQNLWTAPNATVPMTMSPFDLVGAFKFYPRIIGLEPSEEAKKAIVAILRLVDRRKKIFIGPVFLNQQVGGFTGISIYCDNINIGTVDEDGNPVFCNLRAGTDYDGFFRAIKNEPVTLDETNYKQYVELACKNAGKHGQALIDQEYANHAQEFDYAKRNIIALSKEYAKAIKANRIAKDFTRNCPEEIRYFLEKGLRDAKTVVGQVQNLRDSLDFAREKSATAKQNVDHTKLCIREAGYDWPQVRKLLKMGIIESIGFNPKLGLTWTYPPLTYDYSSVREGKKGIAFLGRVRVAINHKNGQKYNIKAISYPNNANYGSYHWGSIDGRHCLGTYERVLDLIVAKRQIAQLILVFKEYILSKNDRSILLRPDFQGAMNIENPQVTDDSFEVWKKNRENRVALSGLV